MTTDYDALIECTDPAVLLAALKSAQARTEAVTADRDLIAAQLDEVSGYRTELEAQVLELSNRLATLAAVVKKADTAITEQQKAAAERDRARANFDRYAAAVSAVGRLHSSRSKSTPTEFGPPSTVRYCVECGQDWPCATERATDEIINGAAEPELF